MSVIFVCDMDRLTLKVVLLRIGIDCWSILCGIHAFEEASP